MRVYSETLAEEVRAGLLRRSHNSFQMKQNVLKKSARERCGEGSLIRDYFKPRFQNDARLDEMVSSEETPTLFLWLLQLQKLLHRTLLFLKRYKMPVHCRRSCLLLLSVYYLKTDITTTTETSSGRDMEFFTLRRRRSGEHFQRTVLSSKIISDHKCDCHYYALRDVLKGLPGTNNECIFR